MTKVTITLSQVNQIKTDLEKLIREKMSLVINNNSVKKDSKESQLDVKPIIEEIEKLNELLTNTTVLVQKHNLESHEDGKSNTYYIKTRSNLESMIFMYERMRTRKVWKKVLFSVILTTKEKKKQKYSLYQKVSEITKKIEKFNSEHFVEFEYDETVFKL